MTQKHDFQNQNCPIFDLPSKSIQIPFYRHFHLILQVLKRVGLGVAAGFLAGSNFATQRASVSVYHRLSADSICLKIHRKPGTGTENTWNCATTGTSKKAQERRGMPFLHTIVTFITGVGTLDSTLIKGACQRNSGFSGIIKKYAYY